MLKSIVKHFIFASIYIASSMLLFNYLGYFETHNIDYREIYGLYAFAALCVLQLTSLIGLPLNLFMLVASLFYNERRHTNASTVLATKKCAFRICFRIVTRGDYPGIVHANINELLELLERNRVENFLIQVVCNKSIRLALVIAHAKVSELVVPDEYTTRRRTKYKARNLQFALERGGDGLEDTDWLLHLDEESRMTQSALDGVCAFIAEGKHHIGQGLLTYGNINTINFLNTMSESSRVGGYYLGALRFCMRTFHVPCLLFNGSFILCRHDVEKNVSFDYGLAGSITEDAYFACRAANMGYSFDWIEGEVKEQSPITFMDFVKQRKRWIQGLRLVHNSNEFRFDVNYTFSRVNFYMFITSPIHLQLFILFAIIPFSLGPLVEILLGLNYSITCYLFSFGMVHQIDFSKRSIFFILICFLGCPIWIFYMNCAQSVAIFWALLDRQIDQFYVVKKSF